MKRSIVNIVKILLLITGFVWSLWLFMPWAEVGKFAVNVAYSQLSRHGMRLGYSDISGVDDGFVIHNLTLGGVVNLSFGSLTIRPQVLTSMLSIAPVCDINFTDGSIQFGQVMKFGDGGVLLTAGRNEILLENLHTNGDFAINGYMTLDLVNTRIGSTNARLDVPADFDGSLDMMRNFLPLEQDGDTWYLRRD